MIRLMILMEATLLPFSVDLIIIWRGFTDLEERFWFLYNKNTKIKIKIQDSSY